MKPHWVLAAFLLLTVSCFAGACAPSGPELAVGGLYSVEKGDGTFGVAKVLALDPGVVSVRTYKQSFSERPTSIDPTALSLGTIHDTDGFGMGHLPITPEIFHAWRPILLAVQEVGEDELDGYHMWKEASGQPFEF